MRQTTNRWPIAFRLCGVRYKEPCPHARFCIAGSRAALTYAEAQSRIDDERLQDELSVNLRRMNAIARVLRRQRSERGAAPAGVPGSQV